MSISVLMSVYRSEKADRFDRALRSVWNDQSLKPDQIVLVEDGPLGHKLDVVVDKWKNRLGDKLTIVANEENIGLTKSLNKGISVAKGDYIARMDSDDISLPERFRLQKEFLDSHPDIMVVGGSIQEFNSKSDNLGINNYPLSSDDCRKYICKGSPFAHPNVMIRRTIFDNGLKYNEKYLKSQDIALWFDVLAAGYKLANLKDVTLKFRRGEGVVARRKNKVTRNNEWKIYSRGICKLYGPLSYRYIYPAARYIFRLMPTCFVRYVYESNIRRKLFH